MTIIEDLMKQNKLSLSGITRAVYKTILIGSISLLTFNYVGKPLFDISSKIGVFLTDLDFKTKYTLSSYLSRFDLWTDKNIDVNLKNSNFNELKSIDRLIEYFEKNDENNKQYILNQDVFSRIYISDSFKEQDNIRYFGEKIFNDVILLRNNYSSEEMLVISLGYTKKQEINGEILLYSKRNGTFVLDKTIDVPEKIVFFSEPNLKILDEYKVTDINYEILKQHNYDIFNSDGLEADIDRLIQSKKRILAEQKSNLTEQRCNYD